LSPVSGTDARSQSRERILRSAAACFAKDGYAQTRMVGIARAAGVSRAGLYTHFASKAELLVALNAYLAAEYQAWIEDRVAGASSAREAIATVLRDTHADSWRLTAVRVVTSSDAQQAVLTDERAARKQFRDGRKLLTQLIQRGIDSGELREDLDAAATAQTIQSLNLGLLVSQLPEQPISGLDGHPDIEALVDILLNGIAKRRKSVKTKAPR